MPKLKSVPFEVTEALRKLGDNIRVARTRRGMQQEELAQRCDLTRRTLYGIEKGAAGVSIGHVMTVLWSLGLLDSVKEMAAPDHDEHGKILEAAQQKQRVREKTPIDNDF